MSEAIDYRRALVAEGRRLGAQITSAQRELAGLASDRRAVIGHLRADGMTDRQIAQALGLCDSRIGQIMKGKVRGGMASEEGTHERS